MNPDQHSPSGAPDRAETEPSPAGEGDSTDGSDRRSSAPARARRQTLSQLSSAVAADQARDGMAFTDLMTLPGGRGRDGFVPLFALPDVLPAPPGLSFQVMPGRVPCQPRFIGHRFALLKDTAAPWLARAERLLRPGSSWLVKSTSIPLLNAFG